MTHNNYILMQKSKRVVRKRIKGFCPHSSIDLKEKGHFVDKDLLCRIMGNNFKT